MLDKDTKDMAQKRLQQLGEQFLSMFEEEGEGQEKPQKKRKKKDTNGAFETSLQPQKQDKQEQQMKRKKKQKHFQKVGDNSSCQMSQAKEVQIKEPDEIDLLMNTTRKVKQKDAGNKRATTPTKTLGKVQKRILKRINRGKVQALFEDESSILQNCTQTEGKPDDTEIDFKKIRHEVGQLGAKELEYQDQRNFQQIVMKSLGGKVAKGKRISKKVGLQIFKEAQEKQKQWEEEALETGMITKQKLVKMKRKQSSKKRDFGLKEDGGMYRPGILKVRRETIKSK